MIVMTSKCGNFNKQSKQDSAILTVCVNYVGINQ